MSAKWCHLFLVCILLSQTLPDYLLLCQQCDPYNLVKQAIQKSMAITQVIDFSTPSGRWPFIVTSEMICQCRMAKCTLLNCYFITYKALLSIVKTEVYNILFGALIDPLCIHVFSLIPNPESSDRLLCHTQTVSSAISTLNLVP